MSDLSQDASYIRESHEEGIVLGFDYRIAQLRRDRDRRIAEIRVDREEHLRLAETLLETERRVEDDYDSRIGDLTDLAEKAEQS